MKQETVNQGMFDLLMDEVNREFRGWDFSHIDRTGRLQEFPLSWNYRNEIMRYIRKAESMLDMGTGGGEFLSSLEILPQYTYATEGYEPNIEIARDRLKIKSVEVYAVSNDKQLPFSNDSFELIINKHESFSADEVARILKPKGTFITQQVGGLNDREINELLGDKESEFIYWNKKYAVSEIQRAGLKIVKKLEDVTKSRFYDVGAIIYYLKAIPWQIPDFSIEKYYEQLVKMHNQICENGYLDTTCHRFLIIAEKA